ncbi:M3 family metallopeptidase [Demequina sp.]|uniref:M3 family metallopeptidase n=1 Tax=Demequina sp. TaxID=2050685 RepID=UPI003D0FAFCB
MTSVDFPTDGAAWRDYLEIHVSSRLEGAKGVLDALRSGNAVDVLAEWNEADIAIIHAMELPQILAECHPDAGVRELAGELFVRAQTVRQERDQDAELYSLIAGIDASTLTDDAANVRELLLGDFRAEGAHLGDEARAELATVNERITALSTKFSENIRDAQASIRIAPERLAGLPQDYIDAHPVGDDGLVTITTEYPDKFPFMEMAHDADARRDLVIADYQRAYPANDAVLAELLQERHRKAELLGLPSFADVATQRMMMPDGDSIGRFIDEVNLAARPAALRDVERLLERKRKDFPDATNVTVYDATYYVERIKAEELGVDANQVREYLDFGKVKQGVLDLTAHLFGYTFELVPDAPTWHPDVEVYDVKEDGEWVGRIHLDMHPREGKFSHMACFAVASGFTNRNVPESSLMCNFPRGLMTFDDLVTFLHEFGHLIHEIAAGQQVWGRHTGLSDQQEWDFVEAPSQMLEEWAWTAPVLQRFATNAAGEPIPTELVDALRASRDFCEGMGTARQLAYAALSHRLHRDHPTDIAPFAEAIEAEYDVRDMIPDTHQYASFGHLTDYSACYYTYQWSLSIAKDMFTQFDPDNLLDAEVSKRYRREVLNPGNRRHAAESVEAFLGRPYSTDAYREWLASL